MALRRRFWLANGWPNLRAHCRTVSWLTMMPRAASNSSTMHREYTLSSTIVKGMIVYCSFHLQCGEQKMKSYRELAMEFIETLKRENAEAQQEIDRYAGYESDVMDQEIRLLRQDIESRFRTIIYLKEELRQLLCRKPRE